MSATIEIIGEILAGVLAAVAIAFVMWERLKKSRDPGMTLVRWLFTGAMLFFMYRFVHRMAAIGGLAQIVGLLAGVVGGIVLAIIWAPAIVDGVSMKIGSLYDGGDEEVDPKPLYSIFQ